LRLHYAIRLPVRAPSGGAKIGHGELYAHYAHNEHYAAACCASPANDASRVFPPPRTAFRVDRRLRPDTSPRF